MEYLRIGLHSHFQSYQVEVGLLMTKGHGSDGFAHGNGNLQLFLKFPLQAAGEIFPIPALPPGELPPER